MKSVNTTAFLMLLYRCFWCKVICWFYYFDLFIIVFISWLSSLSWTLLFSVSSQSLWHIKLFRDEFLQRSTSVHVHVGDPCVICALYEIFTALSNASTDTRREAVAPTSLRIALSNLYPESNFFQEVHYSLALLI